MSFNQIDFTIPIDFIALIRSNKVLIDFIWKKMYSNHNKS